MRPSKPLTMGEESLVDLRNRSFCGAPFLRHEARAAITEIDALTAEVVVLLAERDWLSEDVAYWREKAERKEAERAQAVEDLCAANRELEDEHAKCIDFGIESRRLAAELAKLSDDLVETILGASRKVDDLRDQMVEDRKKYVSELARLTTRLALDAPVAKAAREYQAASFVARMLRRGLALLDLCRAQAGGGK